MKDIIFIQTAIGQTDEQLTAQLRAVMESPQQSAHVVLTVFGFDDDPQELWQIAGVRAHLRRLVDFGVPAILVRSTGIRELCPEDLAGCPGFGGFEVWAHGHELLATGVNQVHDALVQTFAGTIVPRAEAALRRNLERYAHVPANRDLIIEVGRGGA